jgi:hypothetical protein
MAGMALRDKGIDAVYILIPLFFAVVTKFFFKGFFKTAQFTEHSSSTSAF